MTKTAARCRTRRRWTTRLSNACSRVRPSCWRGHDVTSVRCLSRSSWRSLRPTYKSGPAKTCYLGWPKHTSLGRPKHTGPAAREAMVQLLLDAGHGQKRRTCKTSFCDSFKRDLCLCLFVRTRTRAHACTQHTRTHLLETTPTHVHMHTYVVGISWATPQEACQSVFTCQFGYPTCHASIMTTHIL